MRTRPGSGWIAVTVVAPVAVGIGAGLAGALLTRLLHLVQHAAFGYSEDTFLLGVERAPGWRRVAAMALGGLVVGAGWWQLRRHVDIEQVSVTRALRERGGSLPVRATTADAVLQIVAVGSGASLGREGAPRQVGAAWAGWLCTRLQVDERRRRLLLACGAGAGLAAVYNVPLGGALFAVEVLLGSLALRAVVPALVSSAVATVIAWPLLSRRSTYELPAVHPHLGLLLWAAALGVVTGPVAVGFVRLMAAARTHATTGVRMVASVPVVFAIVGALAIPYPELLGNGKGPAQVALGGTMGVALAAALVVLKPLATAACLRSGAIGGLLTPSFATGAALGVLGGHVWSHVWSGGSPQEFALIGAAAMLAVTQRAPLTGLALTVEFAGGGMSLLPALVVAIAIAVVVATSIDGSLAPHLAGHLALPVRGRGRGAA